jgi:deoxyribonuclease IV
MILGVHGSVRAGLLGALDEAEAARAPVLQCLPYRRHHPPSDDELSAFRARRAALGIVHLIVHSRFVPSLASSDAVRRARSVELLAEELSLAQKLGGDSYIVHAGAYSDGSTAKDGMRLAAQSITEAVGRTGFKGPVLVENVPGGGRRLGGALEQLAELRDLLGIRAKFGVCLDTAHAWAQGYGLSSAEGALKFLALAHRLFGDGVRAFHVNDSRALLGSHQEDHAHWGEGYLGKEGIRVLLERPEYADTPAIVETPKTPGGDRQNLDFLAGVLL